LCHTVVTSEALGSCVNHSPEIVLILDGQQQKEKQNAKTMAQLLS